MPSEGVAKAKRRIEGAEAVLGTMTVWAGETLKAMTITREGYCSFAHTEKSQNPFKRLLHISRKRMKKKLLTV